MFYFRKSQRRAIPADQVNLSRARTGSPIPRHYRITSMSQVPIGQGFATRPSLQMFRFTRTGRQRVGRNPRPLAFLPDQPAIHQVRENAHGGLLSGAGESKIMNYESQASLE